MDTLSQCGNLTGAGTTITPADFGNAMTRCTDVNSNGNPATIWQTADEPSVNLWNSDDTAMLLLVNGGQQYVFLWDGSRCAILTTSTAGNITFPAGTVWSYINNNVIYSLNNATGPGIYLQKKTVTLTQGAGAVSSSNMFDWTNAQCLMNPVNGYASDPQHMATITSWSGTGSTVTFQAVNSYATNQTVTLSGFGTSTFFNGQSVTVQTQVCAPSCTQFTVNFGGYSGGSDTGLATATSFPLNKWTGAVGVDRTETVFSVAFSHLGGQGSGYFMPKWTVGQPGCDLLNTLTGTVTHNGTLVGTVPDDTWGGAFGGKAPRYKIHDTNQPTAAYTLLSSGANNYVYGTYVDGTFYWDGALGYTECGITASDWKASNAYNDGDRILPVPVGTNAGGYLYQIINGVSGTSGVTEPTWNQTPGSDTIDNPGPSQITWRNVGIGSSTAPYFTYFCDGHAWKGNLGEATGKSFTYHSYGNPEAPMLRLGPVISPAPVGDNHLGNTYANATDTSWMWVTSTDVGTATNLLTGPLPSALYMENFFVAPPYSSPGVQNCLYNAITCPAGTLGQVRRAFHQYGSGWHKSFDVQNGISVVSQTGNYAMMATDGMGQFGNTAGTTNQPSTWLAKCNVGAASWLKNDTTHFTVGSLMFPDPQLASTVGANTGNYIFKAQSCSGACTTGASHPTWIQPGVTGTAGAAQPSLDGTIQWVTAPDVNVPANSAVQNCRADVMVVKLTR
jgi:hypothetical protein